MLTPVILTGWHMQTNSRDFVHQMILTMELHMQKDLEKKVAMLSEQSLDLDYLEVRARIVLNMVKDGEYVILDKDIDNDKKTL